MLDIFLLLVIFQLKHFLADYPLQTPYMLGKMKATGWKLPLAAHAAVHALITFTIAFVFLDLSYLPDVILFASLLAMLDFTIHFLVDRVKASPSLAGKFKPEQSYFWWALGADQMAHHLTHYFIIAILVSL